MSIDYRTREYVKVMWASCIVMWCGPEFRTILSQQHVTSTPEYMKFDFAFHFISSPFDVSNSIRKLMYNFPHDAKRKKRFDKTVES
jgi:hypothetical protein